MLSIFAAAASLTFAMSATIAFAYPETLAKPSGQPFTGNCIDCHGAQSSTQASNTVVANTVATSGPEANIAVGTRKGPHGGYTSGTQKCVTCHTIHDAPSSFALLPQPTVQATCNTCHDGTGGGGVYGVIRARTGLTPGAQHRIETATGTGGTKMVVPGGDPTTGGSVETSFTGTNGSLTCTDCHNPHNANTVNAFEGDRRRSTTDSSTFSTPTNRLLRTHVTSSDATITEYGSDWCEECHKGRHSQTGTMGNHPVADSVTASGWYYRRVEVLSGYNTSVRSATPTDLGGSNLGYVMPMPRGSQPYPICEQCHEDARSVGNVTQFQVASASEAFSPSIDGSGTGNPRFQNFPHESENPRFLIEVGDSLCLNCHTAP